MKVKRVRKNSKNQGDIAVQKMEMTWSEWYDHPEVKRRIKELYRLGWRDAHLIPVLKGIYAAHTYQESAYSPLKVNFTGTLRSLDRRIKASRKSKKTKSRR
ncbi:MAG: hypothetical protein J7J91_10050 [Deltaproteobacteria bacterium]|nr:hypothetical protein [Deltaproteobacteria bacterium]